jgi:hypothetical protein
MTTKLAVAAALALAAQGALAEAPMEVKNVGVPGVAEGTRVVKETAVVTAIDVAARTVTLKDKKGREETIKVGPQVQRLDEVQVGDTVAVAFHQGLALQFQMPGEKDVAPEAVAVGGRTEKGEAPGGAVAAGVTATVKVTAIDTKHRMVVIQGPQGQYHQVKAGKNVQLDRLKVGDKLVATYVEAVAITLEKAPAKGAKPAKAAKPAAKAAEPAK